MKYLFITIVIFLIEVFIALFVKDSFIRPFFGDFLATILVYTGLMIFFSKRHYFNIAVISLLFSYFIEILQYFRFVHVTGLSKYKVLSLLLGTSFSWWDMLAYTAGFIFILICESYTQKILKPVF
jgi:hypothetical protein